MKYAVIARRHFGYDFNINLVAIKSTKEAAEKIADKVRKSVRPGVYPAEGRLADAYVVEIGKGETTLYSFYY